jgi:tRNA pseudouridine38-40 synthase
MRSKRNVRLLLSYDGTDFGGWQRQDNARTVQGELERALERMHGHPVPVLGAGRTDSGVHAMGQVSNFYTDIASIEAGRFLPALNKLMPRDVRVLSSSDADFDFHSRYDARLRRYRYYALCSPSPDPRRRRYCHHLRRRPDLEALNSAAALILGENDFTAFSSAKDASANRSRYVAESSFRLEGEALVYEIAANAFLWRMVRSLVGSMLAYEAEAAAIRSSERAARTAERMEAALRAKDRSLAGPTAPARGLFLWNVEYYASPTRPGRGDYWTVARAGAGAAASAPDERAEDGAIDEAAAPRIVPGIGPVDG